MPSAASWFAGGFALISGAILGVLFTIAHRARLELFGTEVPAGFILGLVAVTCLLVGLRLLAPERTPVVGASIGIVGSIMMLAAGADRGSLLITDDPLGIAWLVAPAVIAAIVVVWPKTRPRAAS